MVQKKAKTIIICGHYLVFVKHFFWWKCPFLIGICRAEYTRPIFWDCQLVYELLRTSSLTSSHKAPILPKVTADGLAPSLKPTQMNYIKNPASLVCPWIFFWNPLWPIYLAFTNLSAGDFWTDFDDVLHDFCGCCPLSGTVFQCLHHHGDVVEVFASNSLRFFGTTVLEIFYRSTSLLHFVIRYHSWNFIYINQYE